MTDDEPQDAADVADDDGDEAALTEEENAQLAVLQADLARVLGVGVGVGGIEIEGSGPVTLRATLLADGKVREVEAEGETLKAACGALLEKAAGVRLDGAFWQIVGPMG